MSTYTYETFNFRQPSLDLINWANVIIDEYTADGYDLTLRQLYYQMVARDIIPNSLQSYKRLGDILNKARKAGLVSWSAIVDRTRSLKRRGVWTSPQEILRTAISQYLIDLWEGQAFRVEVWVEKDALISVIERACFETNTPYFSCRGYTSQTEVREAAMRFISYREQGQTPVVLHLADHDPSGIDMTRDLDDRYYLFSSGHGYAPPMVRRIALNMPQVEEYTPPPNPAKVTDSRYAAYTKQHGGQSWELDALPPQVLNELITSQINLYIDDDVMAETREKLATQKEAMRQAVENIQL